MAATAAEQTTTTIPDGVVVGRSADGSRVTYSVASVGVAARIKHRHGRLSFVRVFFGPDEESCELIRCPTPENAEALALEHARALAG